MDHTRLFVIRHGETDYNFRGRLQGRNIDAPLNQTGQQQAEAIGEYLKLYQIDKVVSSSLLRSRQTAELIQQHFKLDLTVEPDLDEMDFGDFEGREYQSIKEQIGDVQQRWQSGDFDYPIPGGESPSQVFDRANRAARNQLDNHPGQNIVFIVHGRLIRILLSNWLEIGLNNMQQIEHRNGSINQVVWDGNRFEPVYLNKTDHLGEEATIHPLYKNS
ncbi:MAG: histidine phosphatase family protein [Balneolaceae bacterium]